MLGLSQFAVRMICGMCLVLSAMPRTSVASGFFRVQMLIVMGLGVLAVLAGQTATIHEEVSIVVRNFHWGTCLATCILAFIASVLWTLERRNVAARLLSVISGVSLAALILGVFLTPAHLHQVHWSVVAIADLGSALTLGAAMSGMLLGHSYLTSPTMSISPLSRLNLFLGWSGLLRGAISGLVLLLAWRHLKVEGVFATWFALRWIAGVGGPVMVWQMVQRILVFRNTQAATGVLFVGVILTLLGELTGTLLLASTGYPL